ncbi:hypothetical protein MK280_17650, partial [Myxococcota bacterium]|nr:hypothetical protein [Myxococcota bacterium]
NPAIAIPANIGSPEVQKLFQDERKPGYFVTNPRVAVLLSNVVVLGEYDGLVILQSSANPGPAEIVWGSPPPLICAGREACD